jgi:hypothetical protein
MMDIQKIIKLEICNFIISQLKKDTKCQLHELNYGDYRISTSYLNNGISYIEKQDLGKIKIEGLRKKGEETSYNRWDTIFEIELKKTKKKFFKRILPDKKTEMDQAKDILYDLIVQRIYDIKKQEEYERNQHLVELLPKERRNQFLREQKLTRILKDKEN